MSWEQKMKDHKGFCSLTFCTPVCTQTLFMLVQNPIFLGRAPVNPGRVTCFPFSLICAIIAPASSINAGAQKPGRLQRRSSSAVSSICLSYHVRLWGRVIGLLAGPGLMMRGAVASGSSGSTWQTRGSQPATFVRHSTLH